MRSTRLSTAASVAAAWLIAMLITNAAQAQTFKVLHTFDGAKGLYPSAGVVQDAHGNLYGTTYGGGLYGDGTVFKLSKIGDDTVLHSFNGGNGASPNGVIQDAKGNFYGVATWGGNAACRPTGCGTVFKLSKTGKLTVLYSFTGWPDGAYPNSVIQDAEGNLYGTTLNGGSARGYYCALNGVPYGCGTVFKVDSSGKETVLYSFTDNADGGYPEAGVIQDAEGNLYGTTGGGGAGSGCYHGCGVVFKLSKTGKETVLYRFKGGNDGAGPYAGVIQDAQGNFYGTTGWGGISGCSDFGGQGCGTVFKLSKTGKETVLYRFCSKSGCADGTNPLAGVIQDAKGNLYGTTSGGGGFSNCDSQSGCGTVFKLGRRGEETVLHGFTGGADGAQPESGVIQDARGILYGTTIFGGDFSCDDNGFGCGVAFKLTP